MLNSIDQADKIEEETEATDYDDSLLKALEMKPEVELIFLESIMSYKIFIDLKDGTFNKVTEKYM